MGKYLFLILFFFHISVSYAQVGVHQIQKDSFGGAYNSSLTYSQIELNSLKKSNSLTHTIFGFLPYWENANYKFINYNLLTHIALFDFPVDENGNISIPNNIFSNSWNTVVINSHNHNIKVLMTVTNFDSLGITKIINDSSSKNNFITQVKSIISQYNLDGIMVDFEAPKFADRGEPMNSFMNELNISLKQEKPELEVAFSSPAVNWGSRWNFKGLASSCDYLFLMGYDYYGKWSSTTGPTSPLIGSSQNLTRSLDLHYKEVIQNFPEKLVLGIPYYGLHFRSNSSIVGSTKIDTVISPRYRESREIYAQNGMFWYAPFDIPYTFWQQDTYWNKYFMDNDSSISLKYDLALNRKLKGVGIWALCYDGSNSELWDLLSEKFETTVSIDENPKIPENFSLKQNYPNPFNPSTKIEFSVNEPGNVSLQIFDLLGKIIRNFELVNISSGNNFVDWNGKDSNGNEVCSGTYFYRLIYENSSGSIRVLTKKMILVK